MNTRKMLKALWFTPGIKGRWGLPVIFEGKPGTAKSAQVEDAAAHLGLLCETIIASLREPSDFLGLPIPTADGVEYRPGAWALRLVKAGRGVGFLDEMNTAPPAVQAALLRMVLDGWVGDLELPKTVRWVAAQNSVADAAGGWDLAMPLANRFGHFTWDVPDVGDWCEWLLGATDEVAVVATPKRKAADAADRLDVLDAAAEERQVLDLWPEPYARVRGAVAGFLRRRGELLHKQPQAGSPEASKAWPSPRTWEMATRAYAGAEVHNLTSAEREELMAGFIGSGATGEFLAFLAQADLPDPADVLDGRVKFAHDPAHLDRTCAVLSGCAALIANPTAAKRKERGAALWKLLGTVVGDATDLCVPAGRSLVAAKLHALPEARPVLIKLQPVLQAAGVRP